MATNKPLSPGEWSAFWSQLTEEQRVLAYGLLALLIVLGAMHWVPSLFPRLKLAWDRFIALRGLRTRGRRGIEIGGIFLSDEARLRHTHIVGATGSGKTVLLEHLIYRDLARGHGALIIDPKGERDLYERVRNYCRSIGRERDLHLLSATHLDESSRWNPLNLGTAAELESKFFGAARYSHDYYAKAVEFGLQRAFRELVTEKEQASLSLCDLVATLDQLSNSGKDDALKGLYFDLNNLAFGEWGPILGTAEKPGRQDEVSLLDLTRRNEILFVDLPTEGKAVQAARVGALLLQEITLLSGIRKRMAISRSDRPFSVYVDEFDAFATEGFVTFLNKGRSSDLMIHMAHQTLADLQKVSPTFMGQIMGNPNVRFIFRLDFPDDAERFAKLFGTKTVHKRTFQTERGEYTGRGSAREVQEFRMHPDFIKDLRTGQCILGIKTDSVLMRVQIPPLHSRNLPHPTAPTQRPLLPDSRAAQSPSETKSKSKASDAKARKSLSQIEDQFGAMLTDLKVGDSTGGVQP